MGSSGLINGFCTGRPDVANEPSNQLNLVGKNIVLFLLHLFDGQQDTFQVKLFHRQPVLFLLLKENNALLFIKILLELAAH